MIILSFAPPSHFTGIKAWLFHRWIVRHGASTRSCLPPCCEVLFCHHTVIKARGICILGVEIIIIKLHDLVS